MPFPIDLTRCLAFAPLDTQLEVCTIPSDALRARLALRGLYEQDRITCSTEASGNVLVRTADGREIRIDRPCAVMIEVAASGGAARSSRNTGPIRQMRAAANETPTSTRPVGVSCRGY